MVRVLVVALLLVTAIGTSAQIVSPIEQSYGPYPRPFDGFEPSLAVARDSILLAWSERDAVTLRPQIRIGLLDFNARLVSPITTFATERKATHPIATSDGTSFRVAYLEDSYYGETYAFAFDVDSAGRPTGPPHRFASADWSKSSETAVGSVNGIVLTARWQRPPWPCIGFSCGHNPNTELFWTASAGWRSSYTHLRIEEVGPVGIGGVGNRFMLAWAAQSGLWYIEIVDGRLKTGGSLIPVSVDLGERPAVGCDDTHCLIAYTTPARQVYGVLIDRDRPYLGTPTPIETLSRVAKPQVHVLRNGRFLVTYINSWTEPQHRFAGRIVTTEPQPRRRAAR